MSKFIGFGVQTVPGGKIANYVFVKFTGVGVHTALVGRPSSDSHFTVNGRKTTHYVFVKLTGVGVQTVHSGKTTHYVFVKLTGVGVKTVDGGERPLIMSLLSSLGFEFSSMGLEYRLSMVEKDHSLCLS